MEIGCSYFGNGEFYGLDISENGEPLMWEYSSDAYIDFVLDCLNKNFFSIAAGYAPYMAKNSCDPAETHAALSAGIRERYKDSPPAVLYGLIDHWENALPDILKNMSILEADFSGFDIEYYRRAVEVIYIHDVFPTLLPRKKYFAYQHVYGMHSGRRDCYSALVSMDESVGGAAAEEELYNKIRSTHVMCEDQYGNICRILSEGPQTPVTFGPVYTFSTFHDTFVFLFHEMLRDGLEIKKCEHCGRYFHPTKRGASLCDMPSPEAPAKSCHEYIKYKKYLEKSHTEAPRLHKQIYNQKANKVKRTKNALLQADLERFKAQSEQWRTDVRDGKKREKEYIKWLKDVKENGL